jgi:hypothetical protein
MKKNNKKFPKILYAYRENAGTDNEFVNTVEDISSACIQEETVPVAIYKLVEVKTATNKTVIK